MTGYESGGFLEPGTVYVRLQPGEHVLTGAAIRALVVEPEPPALDDLEPPC